MFGVGSFIIFSWSIVLIGLAAGIWALTYVAGQYKKDLGSRLSEKEERERYVLAGFEELKRKESMIRQKELGTVNLYEITKRMSEGLKFEDIFGVFSSFLKDNFSFKKCDLLILDRQESEPKLERRYEIWKDEDERDGSFRIDSSAAVRLFLKDPREVYLTKNSDGGIFKDLKIEDDSIAALALIPLMSEKKMVGILMVENLPKSDLETLAILAMEFALEIKKALLYETVERLAITDSVTGLYVRRYFAERVTEELQRSKRHKFSLAFLMADIDDFKHCNDEYGHLAGDMVLKDMAHIMKESVREIDLVARYGGEEFAIMLPETGPEGAAFAAERIRRKIEENVFKAYDEKLRITISIGISIYPSDSNDLQGMIESSDRALYEAKKSGKNVVRSYKR